LNKAAAEPGASGARGGDPRGSGGGAGGSSPTPRSARPRLPGQGGSPARFRLSGPADPRLAAAVFAALVLACFAALIAIQRLKHTPTPIESFKRTPSFRPGTPGPAGEERISFKSTGADRVTVTVEDAAGNAVATLVSGLPVARYRIVSLRWNGRRGVAHGYALLRRADGYTTVIPHNRGALAAPGEYKVRVALLRQQRSIPLPQSFALVRP
jgi:hypothetical protein